MKTRLLVLSSIFLLIVNFVCGQTQSQSGPGYLVSEWQRAKEYSKEYLDAMNEDANTPPWSGHHLPEVKRHQTTERETLLKDGYFKNLLHYPFDRYRSELPHKRTNPYCEIRATAVKIVFLW